MVSRAFPWLLLPVLLLAGCSKPAESPAATPAAPGVGAAPGAGAPAPAIAPAAAPATAPAAAAPPVGTTPATAPVAAPAGPSLASQETNWAGISADVVEFRRRGNTVTLKLRLRNGGDRDVDPDIHWDQAYLVDAGNAKKYEALKDENGTYVAAVSTNWKERWQERIRPGESKTVWAKFPAPPPEVKTVTLQVNGMPPFDDLAFQDG